MILRLSTNIAHIRSMLRFNPKENLVENDNFIVCLKDINVMSIRNTGINVRMQ
jgi:hypothetical protein